METSVVPHLIYQRDVTGTDGLLGNVTQTINSSTTENSTEAPPPPEFLRDEQIGFLVILMLFIVIGNSIVLAAIALSKERRRSRMNFFIMHLAVADLLNAPLNVLIDLISKITIYWYAGDVFCRFIQFTRAAVIYASTFMLVALSIDRLDAVARPMNFSGSWLRAKLLIGSAWVLSLVFAAPQLWLFQEKYLYNGPHCFIDLTETWQWQLYLSLIALVIFILPAIIICVCYVVIVAIIWRSSRLLKPSDSQKSFSRAFKSKEEECLNGHSRSGSSKDSSSSSRGIIPQAKIRTIKMTFLIVLVFIICWSPYFIFNLCDVYGHIDWKHPSTSKLSTFIQSLAPLNSAANPIIYGIFSTRICRRLYLFRKVQNHVCKCCKKEQVPRNQSGNEYTSMSETEDIRLTTDIGGRSNTTQVPRLPYVRQPVSESDRELLSVHIKSQNV